MNKISAKVLYAGDSQIPGPANYLFAALKKGGFEVTHLPPDKVLEPGMINRGRFDAIILSDYPKKNCPKSAQKAIANAVQKGSGFMMVGGWASFSAPYGLWHGTEIEDLLPVQCLDRDDRTNFYSGAAVILKGAHPAIDPKIFQKPPAICGLNHVKLKKNGRLILAAKPISIQQGKGRARVGFLSDEFPLLAVDRNPKKRVAAFATDFAPHWCGGLVDWGGKTVTLPVVGEVQVQVGDAYVSFIGSLVRWLCG